MKRISAKKQAVNRDLHKTYQLIDTTREPVCEGCGRGDRPLSHSHIISVNRCNQLRKPELISDKNNIMLECFGSSDCCHDIWEKSSFEKKVQLLNFDKKLEYIKKHDEQRFQTLSYLLQQHNEFND